MVEAPVAAGIQSQQAVNGRRATEPGLSPHLRQRIATTFQSRWENEWGRRFVTHGRAPGPNAVRLDGNDYLSVTGHQDIVQAQLDALRCNRDFIVQSGVFQLDGSPTSPLRGRAGRASWAEQGGPAVPVRATRPTSA